jgi:putative transposase
LRRSERDCQNFVCIYSHGTCFLRIIHINVTSHPTSAWILQQLREAIPSDHTCHFIIHDRDAIFSSSFDASVARLGLEVIATPVRSPKTNALCERLIGTLRRECLDWMIPLTEEHLRKTPRSWWPHYNRGRAHASLGPGLPDPRPDSRVRLHRHRHRFDRSSRIVAPLRLERTSPQYSLLAQPHDRRRIFAAHRHVIRIMRAS